MTILALLCLAPSAFAAQPPRPRAALDLVRTALADGDFARVEPVAAVAPAALSLSDKDAQEFAEALVALVDELQDKDPVLFAAIRAEEERIRALPTAEERDAAVRAGYPRLEAELSRSAAEGRLSAAGAAKWDLFRARAQKALADGTLMEMAEFAGQAFDDKVAALLRRGKSSLDPDRRLPERKEEWLALSKKIHDRLGVPGNSTSLTMAQVDKAFALAAREFGIRPEFLKYMAKTESGLRQVVPSNPAASGIMQVETVHKDAYAGPRTVANDTVTNIVYGGLLRAQTDRAMARDFVAAGLTPPSNPRVVEFLGDLAYNRGPGLLKFVARGAAAQGIDVDRFAEYLAGKGGTYAILDRGRRIVIRPGPGTGIDATGKGSVLALASEAVGRVAFSKKLAAGLGDRNGDGRVDHLDVWLTRGFRYLNDPDL
ncbi:MAG: hypothetical protein HY079_02235 [Elusimicrobia bacterium]|nr:hypothetical protein [Elusimicrobiota bacterium]